MNNREHKKNENFVTQELKKENANDKKKCSNTFQSPFLRLSIFLALNSFWIINLMKSSVKGYLTPFRSRRSENRFFVASNQMKINKQLIYTNYRIKIKPLIVFQCSISIVEYVSDVRYWNVNILLIICRINPDAPFCLANWSSKSSGT